MSLFLSREQMYDLPMTSASGEKHVTHWAGNVLYVVVGAISKVCFRYSVIGRENLRGFAGKSGAVLVSNHASFLDSSFIFLVARLSQWARFMGKSDLFDMAGGLFGQMLARVGAFPVNRDSADRTSVKRAVRMVKDGEIVCIFPEGTRRGKSDRVPEVHAGAALIARMGNVPILPMTVRNVELVKQKGQRLRFPKIEVVFGTPILVSDFDFLPKEDRLLGCTWYAMRECFALLRKVPAEEVDMVALFPDGRDFAEEFRAHPLECRTTAQLFEGTGE